jgi:hypothetical protein
MQLKNLRKTVKPTPGRSTHIPLKGHENGRVTITSGSSGVQDLGVRIAQHRRKSSKNGQSGRPKRQKP